MQRQDKGILKQLCVMVLTLLIGSLTYAETINGREYQRIDGKWYQITSTGHQFLVDTRLITAKFSIGVKQEEIDDINARLNVLLVRTNIGRYSDLRIPDGADPIEYVTRYQESGFVEVVEPNTIGEYIVQCLPNDPGFPQQWGLHNTGHSGGTPDADIDAPETWCTETGKPSVIIGILDSGTDWTHEDLGRGSDAYQNIWLNPGEDAWANTNDPSTGNGIDDDGNGFIDDWKGWDFFNGNNDSRGPFWH